MVLFGLDRLWKVLFSASHAKTAWPRIGGIDQSCTMSEAVTPMSARFRGSEVHESLHARERKIQYGIATAATNPAKIQSA